MAAPSATARSTPTGIMIPHGFRTKVTLSLDPDLEVEEVEVTPSGYDGGEPIPQNSMWSNRFEQVVPQPIAKGTALRYTCRYDPLALQKLQAMVNVRKSGSTPQVCTETFYDGTTRAYYAYVKSAVPDPLAHTADGKMTVEVYPTFTDPRDNTYAEPVIVHVAGS